MERLELNFVPSYAEMMEATVALPRQRYGFAQRWLLLAVSIGAMFAGGILAGLGGVILSQFVPAIPSWASILGFLFLVIWLFGLVLQPLLIRLSARMIAAVQPPQPMRFFADETGARWSDADIDFSVRWSGVEKLFATSKNLGFLNGAVALVLPLAHFESEDQRRDFIAFALERMRPDAAAASRADRRLMALM